MTRPGQMLRYYALWEIALALLALLVGLIGYRQYTQSVASTWARAEGDTAAYASALSARAALAEQQVRRTRTAMQIALAEPQPVPPAQAAALSITSPATGPLGTTWRRNDGPDQIVEFFGDETVPAHLADAEVRATLGLAREFAAERRSNGLLFRSLYGSNDRPLLMAASPPANSVAQSFNEMWRRDQRLTLRDILREVQTNVTAEYSHPGPDIRWEAPYVGDGVRDVQIVLVAKVVANDRWVGSLATTFVANSLLTIGNARATPLSGAYYLYAPGGPTMRIGGTRPLSLAAVLPGSLRAAAEEAARHAGAPAEANGERLFAAPIVGTPWFVLFVAQRSAATRAVMPEFAGYAALLALVVLILLTSVILFRRGFLAPATRLIERAASGTDEALAPATTKIWRPWAEMLDASRARSTRDMAALDQQSRLTRSIVDSALDAVITADASGRITNFNPAAERIFGWSRDEVLGRTMEETIVPVDLRDRHRSGMAGRLLGLPGAAIDRIVELRGLRRDGSEFPMELAVAEAAHGEERSFIGYLRDLSQRKADEAEMAEAREARHQAEKLAALGQLLAGVAHELNNPLAVVVGRAALLEEKLAGTVHMASLTKLREAANRCGRIVKTFLSMARQTGPRRGVVQVNDLIEGAVDMVAYGLRNNQIGLTTALDPALPTIDADEDLLIQVLINLIVNAQHALAEVASPRLLHIQTSYAPGTGEGAIVVDVVDNGGGVPPDLVHRIFDPFYTTKDVGEGTGLGLSVSRNAIESHGGTLEVVPTTAMPGATFRITLPVTARVTATGGGGVVADTATTPLRGRVLIVDDEIDLATMLADCLQPLGLETVLAHDGASALVQVRASLFDLVFCDVRMPGMDGIEFLVRLEEIAPHLVQRFVFVSGDVLGRAPGGSTPGNRPLVEKPFDPDQIRSIAISLLEPTEVKS